MRLPRFLDEPVLRRIMVVSMGTAGAQALVALTLPIVTRLYGPSEIGLANLVAAFLIFATPLMVMRFDSALILAPEEDVPALLVLCGLGAVLITMALTLMFASFQHLKLLGYDELPQWSILIVAACLPGLALFVIGRAIWLRSKKATMVGATTFMRALGQTLGRIGMGLAFAGGFWGLMVGEILMAWAMAPFLPLVLRTVRDAAFRPGRAGVTAVLKRWRRVSTIELPSMIIDNFNLFIIGPVILTLYGAEAAGFFVIAYRLGALPVSQFSRSVGEVLHMEFGQARRDGKDGEIDKLFRRITRMMLYGGLAMAPCFLIGGPLLIGPVLGSEWEQGGLVLAALTPWLIAMFIVGPFTRLFLVLERQDIKLGYDIATAILIWTCVLAAHVAGISFMTFLILLSIGMSLLFIAQYITIRKMVT